MVKHLKWGILAFLSDSILALSSAEHKIDEKAISIFAH